MRSHVRDGGHLRRVVFAMGLELCVISGAVCTADDRPASARLCPACHKPIMGKHKHAIPGAGTLGYGPPGLHPGFQGFGLGYHPGHGYGGAALGVGVDGGYPFYGGPGYPHPWPVLRRIGGIVPFPYFGGPGGPTPDHPNYFGGIGPLAPDEPVVVVEKNPLDPPFGDNYGCFTGMVPYPETTFAPFITIDARGEASSGASPASPPNAPPTTAPTTGASLDDPATSRSLGANAEPFVAPGRGLGLRVTRVHPGGGAEMAGLRVGDVIDSINDYRTESPSHVAWIISHAAPDNVLNMRVRAASDGEIRTISAKLP